MERSEYVNIDYYKILNLKQTASLFEIKAAFRNLALRWHPDKNPPERKQEAHTKFIEIYEAYAILSNSQKRKQYDLLHAGGSGHETQAGIKEYWKHHEEDIKTYASAMKKEGARYSEGSFASFTEQIKDVFGPFLLKLHLEQVVDSKGKLLALFIALIYLILGVARGLGLVGTAMLLIVPLSLIFFPEELRSFVSVFTFSGRNTEIPPGCFVALCGWLLLFLPIFVKIILKLAAQ